MKAMCNRLFVAINVLILLSLGCGLAGRTAVPATEIPLGATLAPTATPLPTLTPLPAHTPPPPTATPVATPTLIPPTPTPDATPTAVSDAASGPRVLWRAGGKDVFTVLGGLDIDGERVYVADAYRGALVFDLEGHHLDTLSPGEIGYVVDVKVGPAGIIYLADMAFHQISMFDANGALLGAFGGSGRGDGEFGADSPRGLAVGVHGEIYVLDPNLNDEGRSIMRVQVFSADGDFLYSLTVGPGYDERALTFGPNDTLLVVSEEGYVAELIPDNGLLIQRLGLDALRERLPQALAVDAAGTMYVTTLIPAAVAILDPAGQFVEWLGEETVRTDEGWPEGEFLFPFGVAVSADGRYVVVGDTFESFAYITVFGGKK